LSPVAQELEAKASELVAGDLAKAYQAAKDKSGSG
jgi:hypothetical protein